MSESLKDYLDFVTETAYLAGRLTLSYFQTGVQADYKIDNSPVTIADKKTEEFIRGRIEKRYPKHAIVGEEFGASDSGKASHRWIIDPIDGTKSFLRGVPLYGVLIGLEIEGEVQVGAAYYPAMDEMLAAATGEGCWWNGRRAHVSNVSSLKHAWVSFTDPASFKDYGKQAAWERLCKEAYYRVGWSDCYGYLLVATGRADVMIDPVMNIWDCGPFPPILREAGGYFGDWKGNPGVDSGEAIATNLILLPELLPLLV
jgi:myo-inositol-1(or 4)-monophosphatase